MLHTGFKGHGSNGKGMSFELMSWAYGKVDVPRHAQGSSSVKWDNCTIIIVIAKIKLNNSTEEAFNKISVIFLIILSSLPLIYNMTLGLI